MSFIEDQASTDVTQFTFLTTDLPLCISMRREGPAAHINEFAISMKTKDQHTNQTCSYVYLGCLFSP